MQCANHWQREQEKCHVTFLWWYKSCRLKVQSLNNQLTSVFQLNWHNFVNEQPTTTWSSLLVGFSWSSTQKKFRLANDNRKRVQTYQLIIGNVHHSSTIQYVPVYLLPTKLETLFCNFLWNKQIYLRFLQNNLGTLFKSKFLEFDFAGWHHCSVISLGPRITTVYTALEILSNTYQWRECFLLHLILFVYYQYH